MEVWVVEHQSQYDSGCTVAVFSNKNDAIDFIENKSDFYGWENNDKNETKEDKFGFYYDLESWVVDENL